MNYGGGSYNNGGSYNGGGSYNNGRNYNGGGSYNNYARGRSSRGGSSNRSYARNGGNYSRDDSKDMMLEHLSQVMDMAVDDRDRRAIEKLMQQMQEN